MPWAAAMVGLGLASLMAGLRWLRPRGSTDQVTLFDRGRGWEWISPGPALSIAGCGLAVAGAAWLLLD